MKQNQSDASTIRQKAEELVKKKSSMDVSKLSLTDAKKLIHELAVHQIELEMQYEELVRAISAGQDANELYNFAHRDALRLPRRLRFLDLSALLVKNLHEYDINKTEDFVIRIYKVAQNNYNLHEDLLMWSQFQLGNLPLNLQTLSFNEICGEVIDTVKVNTDNKNISTSYLLPENVTFFADTNMFKKIMLNLSSNAIKLQAKMERSEFMQKKVIMRLE